MLCGWLWVLVVVGVVAAATPAHAGCCRVTRIDPDSPAPNVRVCEPAAAGVCGAVLFEGALPLGGGHNVCAGGNTIVYQEYDASRAAYGPPTTAVCEGADVEL